MRITSPAFNVVLSHVANNSGPVRETSALDADKERAARAAYRRKIREEQTANENADAEASDENGEHKPVVVYA